VAIVSILAFGGLSHLLSFKFEPIEINLKSKAQRLYTKRKSDFFLFVYEKGECFHEYPTYY
jgi:hypothetical protein